MEGNFQIYVVAQCLAPVPSIRKSVLEGDFQIYVVAQCLAPVPLIRE